MINSDYVDLYDSRTDGPEHVINRAYGINGYCVIESGFRTNCCDPNICSDRHCADKQRGKV